VSISYCHVDIPGISHIVVDIAVQYIVEHCFRELRMMVQY